MDATISSIEIAKTMQSCLNRKTDLLARYGGEEFVVAIMNLNIDQVFERAELIRISIENLKIENKKIKLGFVTISIGIAYVGSNQDFTIEQLTIEADKAMYAAKVNGKNRCEIMKL
ncbi:MAG: GGDEF domain-containing protein [Acidaminobacteraceae bacterium]